MIKCDLPDIGLIWGRKKVISSLGCAQPPSEGDAAALLAGMHRVNKEVVRSCFLTQNEGLSIS